MPPLPAQLCEPDRPAGSICPAHQPPRLSPWLCSVSSDNLPSTGMRLLKLAWLCPSLKPSDPSLWPWWAPPSQWGHHLAHLQRLRGLTEPGVPATPPEALSPQHHLVVAHSQTLQIRGVAKQGVAAGGQSRPVQFAQSSLPPSSPHSALLESWGRERGDWNLTES